jgi:hypothetical protein
MINFFTIVKRHFFSAALFTGCCFVYGCENDEKQIKALTENVQMVEEGRSIQSFFSQDGVMKAKLTAPLMYRVITDSLYVEFPNTLHVDFYNDSTQIESWLDSKYGKYFESLNKVYLRDSVIVINIKGDTLRAPDLWWDQSARIFYTDKRAEYKTKDKHIFGNDGLVATQDMSTVTFNGPTGVVGVSENGTPR